MLEEFQESRKKIKRASSRFALILCLGVLVAGPLRLVEAAVPYPFEGVVQPGGCASIPNPGSDVRSSIADRGSYYDLIESHVPVDSTEQQCLVITRFYKNVEDPNNPDGLDKNPVFRNYHTEHGNFYLNFATGIGVGGILAPRNTFFSIVLLGFSSLVTAAGAWHFERAADPPDFEYEEIYVPVVYEQASFECEPQFANQLLMLSHNLVEYGRAELISLERAQGAIASGDAEWFSRQEAARANFATLGEVTKHELGYWAQALGVAIQLAGIDGTNQGSQMTVAEHLISAHEFMAVDGLEEPVVPELNPLECALEPVGSSSAALRIIRLLELSEGQ